MSEWKPIETAPKDGTAFMAKIPGHGSDNIIAWTDGLLNSDDQLCGGWQFVECQEPPDCWTDGVCWEVNEDGKRSVEPTEWRPLPPTGTHTMSEGTAIPAKCVICGGNIGYRTTCIPMPDGGVAHPSCAYPLNANTTSATPVAERQARIAGLREAAEIAGRFPATYDDGVSLHAENMTCARIRREILARIAELEKP